MGEAQCVSGATRSYQARLPGVGWIFGLCNGSSISGDRALPRTVVGEWALPVCACYLQVCHRCVTSCHSQFTMVPSLFERCACSVEATLSSQLQVELVCLCRCCTE